jgi:hypothetical protein
LTTSLSPKKKKKISGIATDWIRQRSGADGRQTIRFSQGEIGRGRATKQLIEMFFPFFMCQ